MSITVEALVNGLSAGRGSATTTLLLRGYSTTRLTVTNVPSDLAVGGDLLEPFWVHTLNASVPGVAMPIDASYFNGAASELSNILNEQGHNPWVPSGYCGHQ